MSFLWLSKKAEGRVPLWFSRLRIQHFHCSGLGRYCGIGSIPGPGTSTCMGKAKKQTNKKQTNKKTRKINSPLRAYFNTREWLNYHAAQLFLESEWCGIDFSELQGNPFLTWKSCSSDIRTYFEVLRYPKGKPKRVSHVSYMPPEKYLSYWERISIFWSPKRWTAISITWNSTAQWFLLLMNPFSLGENSKLSTSP